jgi:hypothetical protein
LTATDNLLDRSLPRRRDRSPLWHYLAICGLSLFFFDIVARRVQMRIPTFKRSSKSTIQEVVEPTPLVRRAIAASRKPSAIPPEMEPKEDLTVPKETPEVADQQSQDLQELIKARRRKRKKDR